MQPSGATDDFDVTHRTPHRETDGAWLFRRRRGLATPPMTQTSLVLRPKQKLIRSAWITRLGLMTLFVALAVFETDPVGRALAIFVACMFGLQVSLMPQAGRPTIVATEAGLESRFFGLLTWDEFAALGVRETRCGRSLDIYDRDRKAIIRRTRPRLLQVWMFSTQRFRLPLLRIPERTTSFDAVQFRSQLQQLAGRTFPER